MIAGGSYADAFGTAKLTANTWSYLTETYDGSTLRLYVNGTQVASTAHTGAIATSTNPLQIGGDSLYGQFFAGPDRRGPRLQRRAHRRPDPDRPDHPGDTSGDPAVAAGDADRDRGLEQRGRPVLGCLHRQRRRHRLPDRALPGRELHQLHPDRHHDRHRHQLQGHQRQRVHQLQLPRARHRRRRQPQPLLQHRQRHHPRPAVAAGDADRDRGLERRGRPVLGCLHRNAASPAT